MYKTILVITFIFTSAYTYCQLDDNYISYLEESLSTIENDHNPIGLSVAVVQGDDVWSSAIGISSETEDLTTKHLLAMGSVTKTFISACILSMMEEGQLTLNNTIDQYTPPFENIDPSITIRQLLNHSSGIYNYTDHPSYFSDVVNPFNEFREYASEEVLENYILEPLFDKGTQQEYSNSNYVILGMIITQIASRPYYEEISERFEIEENYPSISISPFLTETIALADLWVDIGSGLENIEALGFGLDGIFSSAGAAGAFVGTPTDIAKWGRDLYSGELLEDSTLDSMLVVFGGGDSGYGLGVTTGIAPCGIRAMGHSGGILYTSNLFYVPEYDLSVVAMTNDGNGIPETDGVVGITLDMICNYKLFVDTEETLVDDLSLNTFPNPVIDKLNIEISGMGSDLRVEIFSYEGSRIYEDNFSTEKIIISLPQALSQGIFYLRLSNDENSITKKLIKQ